MGTSSITRVIVDGVVKVNQYCQFDGNPTSRGKSILDFMKSLILENRLDQMKNALSKVTLINRSETDPELMDSSYTGAPLTKDGIGILTRVEYYRQKHKFSDTVEMLLSQGKLTDVEACY